MSTRDNPVRFAVWSNDAGDGGITVGDYCIILPGARVSSATAVTLGKSCMLASNSYITDADWHDIYNRNSAPGRSAAVVLGDNVWIGDSAIVCKGVRIGENSIIGAGSVVTSDVPANVVAAGNPAAVVKPLDPTVGFTTRERLFDGDVPYEVFTDGFDRQILGKNTIAGWLQSMVVPNRST
jgi:acetyltransferase-like isoleucine patch superfamily enzyme